MRFSKLTARIAGEGAAAWDVHSRAVAARAKGEDVVVMSIGETDFATPDPIVDEAVRALRGGDTHYTSSQGRPRLRAAIAARARARYGIAVESDGVAITSGCQNALYAAAQLLLEEGDEALVLEPMYVTYEASLKATGAVMVPVPCPAVSEFHPDIDALRAAVGPRTRAIFLATPVNPTGAVLTREELEEIAAVARQHDLWVVSDEVYADFVYEGEHVAIACLEGMAERTLTLGSLSKSHAMTGWRVGWVIGPRSYIAHMSNLALCMTYGLPGFIQEGAAIALEQDLEIVDSMKQVLRARRDKLHAAMSRAPGLNCWLPAAGMFLLLGVDRTGLSSRDFCERLYEDERVSSVDGGAFGASTAGTLRLSFAASDWQIDKGCERILRFAEALREKGDTAWPRLANS